MLEMCVPWFAVVGYGLIYVQNGYRWWVDGFTWRKYVIMWVSG